MSLSGHTQQQYRF